MANISHSGTARFQVSSFDQVSVSPLVLSHLSYYSSEEHGQCGSEQVLVPVEPGKRQMVSNRST